MNSIDFDGIRAKRTCDFPQCQIWEFFDYSGRKVPLFAKKVGQLVLFPGCVESMAVWVAANMWLTVRGHGLMRQLIAKIKPEYPNLCSCLAGTTSPDACRMFEALGAEKFVTKECPKGYIYLLK
jgi:hypothetical protein